VAKRSDEEPASQPAPLFLRKWQHLTFTIFVIGLEPQDAIKMWKQLGGTMNSQFKLENPDALSLKNIYL
jgi:hypothetical protein